MSEARKREGFNATDAAALALLAIQAAAAFIIYVHGPTGPIAVHFDITGHPNGWASRQGLAIGVGVLAIATGLVGLMLRLSLLTTTSSARTNRVARGIFLAVSALVTALLTSLAFAQGDKLGQLPLMVPWLIFIVVGAFMGKTSPNAFVGVRVYWTFRSRLAWDKANRLLGRILLFGGLVGALTIPFVDPNKSVVVFANIAGLLIVGIGGGALAVFESWRVWRTDPDRIP